MTPVVVLTIAGSDSSGGAGLQADLKTFAAHRVHGASAVTAVTAQNTTAVTGVVALEPAFVVAQIDAVLADLPVAGVKTGMLATSEIVAAIAAMAAAGRLPNLTVDPVLVSSTGHLLTDEGGVTAFRELLLPCAEVATPNLREAAVLTGRPVSELATVEAMIDAAEEIRALGATTVVVKGGHLAAAQAARVPGPDGRDRRAAGPASPDVIAGPDGVVVLEGGRVATANDHGTGCSLSAAIAAGLALGDGHIAAIRAAKDYVAAALAGAAGWHLGSGHGPIDHFGWSADRSGPGAARP
ncbi:MAG TPA: bifunctional hydroxymethylpyrimidine kinase/phosphomethylpyrimidine kinase [Candidatus Dormibacteraeota bacterium]|nr:bifunctional hydroxymethylpyrimidine kinase/phosphomethylpyrimidine kinase [Candidatus Dormibacteraeota bacterium]